MLHFTCQLMCVANATTWKAWAWHVIAIRHTVVRTGKRSQRELNAEETRSFCCSAILKKNHRACANIWEPTWETIRTRVFRRWLMRCVSLHICARRRHRHRRRPHANISLALSHRLISATTCIWMWTHLNIHVMLVIRFYQRSSFHCEIYFLQNLKFIHLIKYLCSLLLYWWCVRVDTRYLTQLC